MDVKGKKTPRTTHHAPRNGVYHRNYAADGVPSEA